MVEFTDPERALIVKLIEFRKASTFSREEESLCLDILDKLEQARSPITWRRIGVRLACGHETWVSSTGLENVYCTKCGKLAQVLDVFTVFSGV